ncbi:unnamed protein product [Lactuca virosa]|uniref:Uncharacterized protein n=1 Tax=Lactuca virosa TaxID=75947 RepID=A0AAU9MA83_9ASTR|nr:unnamed protein product [Lactuca virosa]
MPSLPTNSVHYQPSSNNISSVSLLSLLSLRHPFVMSTLRTLSIDSVSSKKLPYQWNKAERSCPIPPQFGKISQPHRVEVCHTHPFLLTKSVKFGLMQKEWSGPYFQLILRLRRVLVREIEWVKYLSPSEGTKVVGHDVTVHFAFLTNSPYLSGKEDENISHKMLLSQPLLPFRVSCNWGVSFLRRDNSN